MTRLEESAVGGWLPQDRGRRRLQRESRGANRGEWLPWRGEHGKIGGILNLPGGNRERREVWRERRNPQPEWLPEETPGGWLPWKEAAVERTQECVTAEGGYRGRRVVWRERENV